MSFILDDGSAQGTATQRFLQDLCAALIPRAIAEEVLGTPIGASDDEKHQLDEAFTRFVNTPT